MIICGYCRLSRDEDKENYSSIESQQDIINNYSIKNFGKKVDKVFIDDNYSGYTFDRPAFNQIKQEIEQNEIDVIIAKDLSRIGRHNAKTLLFIEEMQLKEKRIILPEEGRGYDSDEDDNDTLGITTWYNERYVKDISKKVKSSIKSKQKNGNFLINEFYGYKKDPQNKHQLIIDEKYSWVIKLIFDKYLNGMGSRKIANYLTDNKIHTPSQAIQLRYEEDGKTYNRPVADIWYAPLVTRIISNDVYTGTLRLNKTKKIGIKGKSISNSKEEQFIFENDHEAIVKKEDFDLAQNIANKRKIHGYKGGKRNSYLFLGLLFCTECKKPIIGHTSQHGTKSYICTTFHNRGKEYCSSHRISEENIVKKFIKHLEMTVFLYEDEINSLQVNRQTNNYDKLITKIEKEIKMQYNELKNIFIQKTKDINKQSSDQYKVIVEQSYNEIEEEKKNKIIRLEKQLDEIKQLSTNDTVVILSKAIDHYKNIIKTKNVTCKQLELAISRIEINKDKECEFILNDDFSRLAQLDNSLNKISM